MSVRRNDTRVAHVFVISILGIGHCCATVGSVQGAETTEVAEVRKSIEARGHEVKSVSFTLATEVYIPSGSSWHPLRFAREHGGFFGIKLSDLEDLDSEDILYGAKHALKIDGDKIHDYSEGPDDTPIVTKPTGHIRKNLETLNGKEARSLRTSTIKGISPQGKIAGPRGAAAIQKTIYLPILYLCRPGDTDLLSGEKLSLISPDTISANGHACIQLQCKRFGQTTEFLLAPALNYCVVRRTVKRFDGSISIQLDVLYDEDERFGAVPITWTVNRLAQDGRVQQLSTATVQRYEINPTIPASEFTIDFPHGTLVSDELNAQQYISGPNGEKSMLPLP